MDCISVRTNRGTDKLVKIVNLYSSSAKVASWLVPDWVYHSSPGTIEFKDNMGTQVVLHGTYTIEEVA